MQRLLTWAEMVSHDLIVFEIVAASHRHSMNTTACVCSLPTYDPDLPKPLNEGMWAATYEVRNIILSGGKISPNHGTWAIMDPQSGITIYIYIYLYNIYTHYLLTIYHVRACGDDRKGKQPAGRALDNARIRCRIVGCP